MNALRRYLLALQFFSRLPVTGRLAAWVGYSPALQRASLAHWPGVGWPVAALGAAAAAMGMTLLAPSPWAPLVAAVLALAAMAWATGGLHEDGLADVADALGGWASAERALEIMKDSRLGAYGALALGLALLARAALLAVLLQAHLPLGLLSLWAVASLSRAAPLWLARRLPYVRPAAQAKNAALAGERLPGRALAVAGLWSVAPLAAWAWMLGPMGSQSVWAAATLLAVACAAVAVLGRWFQRRLGGITGDCLGAAQQGVEIALLFTAAAWVVRCAA